MEIGIRLQDNLEAQLENYEKLLNLAEEKSSLLLDAENRDAGEIRQLAKSELEVVSVLKELESERVEICGEKNLKTVISDSPTEQKDVLQQLGDGLKQVVEKLTDLNQKNTLALQTSLKVISKVISTVRDLHGNKKATYSRVRRTAPQMAHRAVNFKA
jgi:flagellar biosynthesis/type III secretory pathway chaperone